MRKTYNRSKANLGKQLERLIDMTNKQYFNKGFADIRKIPTPVQITGNNKGNVTGKLLRGEWVDYVGVYDDRTIIFDVKETSSNTSFPLKNIPNHQRELLHSWWDHGADSFIIVQFTGKHEEIYMLLYYQLNKWWEESLKGGRKSIPYDYFVENCERVKSENGYTLDYLSAMERGYE